MENVPGANRFAPPAAVVDDVVVDVDGPLAGRWARLGAAFIDGLLSLAAFWIIARLSSFNLFNMDPSGSLPVRMGKTLIFGFLIFLLLQGYLLHTRGQTIGKVALKIRIVRSDGSRASLVRLVGLRYFVNSLIAVIPFVGWIYGLADPLFIFRDSRKCLHDNIADTVVVKA